MNASDDECESLQEENNKVDQHIDNNSENVMLLLNNIYKA